jgi:E3 ubiquitin-protein ligase SHPRH
LASQWADELAAHAPSLKVLVYNGWSKVSVPITQTQLEQQRVKMQNANVKAQKRAAKSKTKGKRKKTDDDDEMEIDSADQAAEDVELLDWCAYVHTFDVVITTYTVLRSDLDVARAAPIRPRREDVIYTNVERPRSPLVMVEWNRVVMDEVQMVGGGKTELRRFHVLFIFSYTYSVISETWSPSSLVSHHSRFQELLRVPRLLIYCVY